VSDKSIPKSSNLTLHTTMASAATNENVQSLSDLEREEREAEAQAEEARKRAEARRAEIRRRAEEEKRRAAERAAEESRAEERRVAEERQAVQKRYEDAVAEMRRIEAEEAKAALAARKPTGKYQKKLLKETKLIKLLSCHTTGFRGQAHDQDSWGKGGRIGGRE